MTVSFHRHVRCRKRRARILALVVAQIIPATQDVVSRRPVSGRWRSGVNASRRSSARAAGTIHQMNRITPITPITLATRAPSARDSARKRAGRRSASCRRRPVCNGSRAKTMPMRAIAQQRMERADERRIPNLPQAVASVSFDFTKSIVVSIASMDSSISRFCSIKMSRCSSKRSSDTSSCFCLPFG